MSHASEYWRRKDEERKSLVCRCVDPDPDAIGECSHCRRLVASTVRKPT